MKGPSNSWLVCLTAIALLTGVDRATGQAARRRERTSTDGYVALPTREQRTSFQAALGDAPAAEEPYYAEAPADVLRPVPAGVEGELETIEEGFTNGQWYDHRDPGEGWYGDPPCLGCGEPDDCCACEWDEFSGCPAPWFVTTEAIFTQRQRSRNRIVSRDRADPIQVISGGQLVTVANATAVMGTKSIGSFRFEPGLRLTLGRYLGRDMLNRDHTLEFTYFGLLDWSGSARVNALTAFLPVPTPGNSQVPIALGGSLVTDFPTAFPQTGAPSVGGFNYVNTHSIDYWSHANNFELNYRLRRALGRDSLVGCPDGSWQRQLTPGHTPSFFGGVRYFELDERFYLLSQGAYLSFVGVTPSTGEYTIHTRNRLIGGQIGGDLIDEHIRWNWGARGKVGLYANFADQDSTVYIDADPDVFTVGNQFTNGSDQRLAFIGEFGLVGNYRWTPNVTFRVAWDMIWVSRLALAPEQLNFTFPQTNEIITTGGLFFNTFSVGAEVSW